VKVVLVLAIKIVLFFAASSVATAGSLTLLSSAVCEGVAETPILASQLQGVASISIKINYDSTKVQYLGVRKVHPSIGSGITSANGGKFIVAWFSLTPIQITSDTLLIIRWVASNGGLSNLQFDTQTPGNCELTNLQGNMLTTQFVNGSVEISGAKAPIAMNPTTLFNLNQTNFLFVYRRPSCMQLAVLQVSRDSLFSVPMVTQVMNDTTFRYFFPALSPPSGDSVLWWRMGGIYNGDTSWAAAGRMSFALTLSVLEKQPSKAILYPNPFEKVFYIQHSSFEQDPQITIQMHDPLGRLLWQGSVSAEAGRIYLDQLNFIQNQTTYIRWRNKIANDVLIANKSSY